jgi:Zn-dependent peptidase ImmA (M78 family)
MRIDVAPKMLAWARQRARLDIDSLLKKFPKLNEWEQSKTQPTIKQLEEYASKTHLPFGVFFLPEPPKEDLPIPDFRTMGSTPYSQASPDLLETIYLCQQRQEWYRDFAKIHGHEQLGFVGSKTLEDDVIRVAIDISSSLHFSFEHRQQALTWTDALRLFVEQVEKHGIMVMASGVVGSNNYRKLDPEEFRGFVMVDNLAPLVFINSNDTLSAKTFTLAHELAHIWLGESGVSNMLMEKIPDEKIERWCNQVAAELLVPLADLRNTYDANNDLHAEMERLARRYKVSTLVVLCRIFDLRAIAGETFWEIWNKELERLKKFDRRSGTGGDFYRTSGVRISKRFARALVMSTLEGQTLFRDAFRMLGIKKNSTFYEIASNFGFGK